MWLWEHNTGVMELQKPGVRSQVLWATATGSLAVALAVFVFLGYYFEWEWTGFPPKKLFDWIQILVIPVAVAVGTFTLNRAAKRRDDKDQKKQKEREEARQEQHAQDTALEAYLEQMTQLLLREQLLTSGSDSVVRTVARAQTLTILGRLGPSRKRSVLQFLHESKLIEKDDPVISLEGADLRKANLSRIKLPEANLGGADLRWANLNAIDIPGTDLAGAHLEWANISGYLRKTNLSNAHLREAKISATDLGGANLKYAGLFGADLGSAKNLHQEQIEVAMGDRNTLLPYYLKQPQSWELRDMATRWRFDEETDSIVYEPNPNLNPNLEDLAERGAKRIRLPLDGTSAVIQGAVIRGDRDAYLLGAQAGQKMVVNISSLEDNAVFQIYAPSGEQALPGTNEREAATAWKGELPTSGDYMIIVGGTRGNASYNIEVKVA